MLSCNAILSKGCKKARACQGLPLQVRRADLARGFSLIEMLVSIAIIVLLMSAVFPFLFQAQKRFQGNVVVSEANQGARAGLEVMAQEIGQAGFNPQFSPNKTSTTAIIPSGCPQYIHVVNSDGSTTLKDLHPGDWVSVDTGAQQELLEVFATSDAATTPAPSCSPCASCPVAPAAPWILAKFEMCHNATTGSCSTSAANNPYIITSYKMPYASGIMVSFSSAGNLNRTTSDCTGSATPNPCPLSNDKQLMFYGDINQTGEIDYVVYSISPMVPATTATINGSTYTLYNLYRSIQPVTFINLPNSWSSAYSTTNATASPMVEKVLYNTTNAALCTSGVAGCGPTGLPVFAYPNHQQIGTAPNVYTALGTIVITLCVAVNPQAMETGQVQWYTMATQIRPLNLNAAINVNNSYGGLYISPTPLSLPMTNPANYYP